MFKFKLYVLTVCIVLNEETFQRLTMPFTLIQTIYNVIMQTDTQMHIQATHACIHQVLYKKNATITINLLNLQVDLCENRTVTNVCTR